MIIQSFPPLPNSIAIRHEAINILMDTLGVAKATIFLGEILWQPTDYLKTKEELFVGETVDSLYQKILDWRETIDP
jgi:hypothetical protein